MNANDLAAKFISEVRWQDLPSEVKEKARMCLVDNLGATLAGTLTRASKISAAYAAETWVGGEATILLHGLRANAAGAAFANGAANNGIDIDDSARYAYGHAGAQVFPTALAVAEARKLSGADMLCGMVVGYEVAHRVGRCWHDHHSVFQACGSWGTVACAAASAHLMRLNPDQAWHALGISEYHAPNLPMMRDIDDPAMVKHGIHWAPMAGVVSAGLAAVGFTGIPGLLAFDEYQKWGQDIGKEYLMVDGVAWKETYFACCGWAHAGVVGAQKIIREHTLELNQIERIIVAGSEGAARLGVRLPETTEEAQFNQAWPVAAMLIDGEIGPAQMLEDRLQDPQIRDLASHVEVILSPEMQRLTELFELGDPEGRFASEVTIVTIDGRKFHSGVVDGGLRFPQKGWDRIRMEEKFRWLASFVLPPSRIDDLLSKLWEFESIPDISDFTRELAAKP